MSDRTPHGLPWVPPGSDYGFGFLNEMTPSVQWCRKCLMPSSRPRIVFEGGVCNACRFHESLKEVNWVERRQAFLDLVRAKKKHPAYDCIVPFSGGKDSASIAFRLKHDLGLNPLLVCYGQLLWTDVGRRNFNRVCEAGFDIHYWRTNQEVSRKLARRFFIERGHPKNHYDAAVNAVPLITAVQFGIPLVIYAEHGESAYGGHVLSEDHRRRRDLAEVLENQVGDDARNWAVDGISEGDLYPYIYPSVDEIAGTEAVYWSWYMGWDVFQNARYCQDKLGFEFAQHGKEITPLGKSDGSFEGFDSIDDMIDDLDFYMMHVKFGFGRAARMASRMIQSGHMTRDLGLAMVNQFDGEFPKTYLQSVLDYLCLTEDETREIINKHRNHEIWKRSQLTSWALRYPPR